MSTTHRDGRHKAAFFTRYEFSLDSWENLAESLLRHASDHEVNKIEVGRLYFDEGEIVHAEIDGETGFKGVIKKPYDLVDLQKTVRGVINQE